MNTPAPASPSVADAPPPPARLRPGRQLRYFVEYLAVRGGRGLVKQLPLRAGIALAEGLAALAFPLMRNRRAIAVDNILKAGLAQDEAGAVRLARASFRHFAVLMVEAILAERIITPDNWREYIDVSEAQELLALVNTPGIGVILASAHFGNWEVAGQVLSQFKPMAAIVRRMNNPYADRLIQARKLGRDFRMILKHEARPATLLNVLKTGHVLGMVVDQHARYRGMMIPFLGRPAATNTSAAILHLRSGAPMCFAYCIRTGPMHFRFICRQVFLRHAGQPQGEDGILAITEAMTRRLEEGIREFPEQYLWSHRRWRIDKSHRLRVPGKYET